ncbi:MAG: hypothetical protein LM513_05465 [Nitrospira sp.]|nr:hypothetical protein [Nitrospira sp.]
MSGKGGQATVEIPDDLRELREALAAVEQMLADWLEKNAATLDPYLEWLTPDDLSKYQYLSHLRMFFPTDYMEACRDKPDYLRVLAQDRLIDEKRAAEGKSKAEKPD